MAAGRTVVARHLEDGTLLRNYTRVLEIILRLRQICDAASLCTASPPDPAKEASNPEKATPELLARLAAVLEVGAGLRHASTAGIPHPFQFLCISGCGSSAAHGPGAEEETFQGQLAQTRL